MGLEQTTAPAGVIAGMRVDNTGMAASRRKAIMAAGVGNALEWYDFTVYAYLAVILAKHFFTSSNETVALLATFAVFGVGFVARPFGGILIGLFGDRYGRKPALLLTFGLMIVSTGMIGVLPTYERIGIAAPVLLVLARLMQGVSAGGEWGGAASFLVEWAPPKRRGLFGSFHPFAICVGQLVGAGVAAGLTSALGTAAMEEWGWRVPFLLGALIAPVGIYIRRNVDETPAYQRLQTTESIAKPAAAADFSMAKAMMLAFAFPILQSVLTYLFLSYFPTFGQRYVGLTASSALWSTVLATAVMAATCVISGALSDVVGRRTCLLAASALSLLLAYPMISLMIGAPTGTVVLLHMGFAAINGIFLGALASTLVEMFPTARRMTGLTTAYNLQSMLFGGFAPFIASWLIATTGKPISIAFLIMFGAALSGVAVLAMRETAHSNLD
jgi:MHS family proline/betaine transporter-like MFS transporter